MNISDNDDEWKAGADKDGTFNTTHITAYKCFMPRLNESGENVKDDHGNNIIG